MLFRSGSMRQTRISKLGIKFMASTLLPALIVLILAGIVCYSVVSQNRISTIRQEVAEQALLCDTEIEDELVRLSELIGLEKGKNTIYNYLTNVESNQKLYFYTKAMKLLNEFTGYNQSIVNSSWVALFDKNLMFSDEYSLEPQKTIQDFSELPWYSEKYLMENEQYVSDVYSAMLGNNKRETKVISIVQPVFDNKTRALIGAYGIDISMIYLNNLLLLDNYSDTLAIVYKDKNDLIFYNGARTEDDYSSLVTDLFTQRAGADKYVVFNERSYYVVSTRFSDMNWFVDYYIRKDDIQNSVNSIAMPLIVTFIIAGVVLTVIMIMFITKFIERVRIVTNNTSEISRGKFDNRMVIDSDDEFGELAIAFNDTIEHLQYKAEHDDITDVYNISTFYVQAERIIKNGQFDRKKYSIVRLDRKSVV